MLTAAAIMLALGQVAAPQASVTVLTPDGLAGALENAGVQQPGLDVATLAQQPGYSVLEIRRAAAGGAEVHASWADIWYVLRGEATLVTGGSVVDGVPTEPGEIRGKGIDGGEQRQLKGGEVVVVPPGVPHWVSRVQGELVYLVVKAPAAPGGSDR